MFAPLGSLCSWLALAATPALLLSAPGAHADLFPESDYPDFAEEGQFDPDIPPPGDFLSHRIGARPTWHAAIVDYLEALGQASPRAELFTYGQSYEGRDLVVLIVSSRENMARLGEIRANLSRLADPRGLEHAEREQLLAETPAVCWMAYTIHGDELSGSDAALALAYRLTAGADPRAAEIREHLVVIIDPLQNPDGHDRFLAQITAFNGRVPNPDPQSLPHRAAWPWGRGNHYFFDLNRDWFLLVHPESQARVAAMSAWHPQLVVDGHEMGSADTYLFSPPRAPFNPYMTRELHHWWDRFARDQARAFDQHGWSYYTREWNEEWFPGYGSTWCIYTGAIGILYEQAGTEGTVVRRPDGTILTYGEAVHHQFVSSLANLTTAAQNRRQLLGDYAAMRASALEAGRAGSVRSFLFPPGPDPARIQRLIQTLLTQGIEVEVAAGPIRTRDVHDHWGSQWNALTLPAGTFRVPLAQPGARLARVILDYHIQMPDSFLVEERHYLERQKGTRLYEATAWSPALAYGIPVLWTGKNVDGPLEHVRSLTPPAGRLENPGADYGYVFSGQSDAAIQVAAHLAAAGYVVRCALDEFTIDGITYPRGSFVLRVDANPPELAEYLAQLCAAHGTIVRGVATALASGGPDLGGNRFRALVEPRIAMLMGNGVNLSSQGSLYYLFDYELGLRVSLLPIARLIRTDLSKYNVLILPAAWGGAGAYDRALGQEGTARLRAWVADGGTLIGVRSAAAFLADSTRQMSQVRRRRDALEDYPIPIWGLDLVAAERAGLFQAMGVDLATDESADDDQATQRGPGPLDLGIPGPGSPVLGPGALAFAGKAGRAGAWTPPPALDPELPAGEWRHVDERLRRFHPQGVFLRVDLDPDHWLTSGLPDKIPAFVSGSDAFVARNPVRTVARFAAPESLHVAGLLWPEAAARLALTACATREGHGQGQVILLAVEPYFRAYTHATKRLLLNAAILGPGLGTQRSVPW